LKKRIAIVGGGACALMLACELNPSKFEVSVYEKNAAPGRKFLVAGEGGLNLTHSENEADFVKRYTPPLFLESAFKSFSNKDLIYWLSAIGIETYIGSSGRVFPVKGIKPIEVLNHFLDKIKKNKTNIYTKYKLKDFSGDGVLFFENESEITEVKSDLTIFCMGGASWPVTGSVGDWTGMFSKKGIKINPFRASNCSFHVDWPESLLAKIEGKALKNISVGCGGKKHSGEMVITHSGLEGSGIYPLSPEIRGVLERTGTAEITIDLKPALSLEKITGKIKTKTAGKNVTERLKNAINLGDTQILLLKNFLSKADFLDNEALAKSIKQFRLSITGLGPVEQAISTVGGIALEEVDPAFRLKKIPGHFVIGEMLDYDAPTGGYLLQSCFSMAKYLSDRLNSGQS